MGIDWDYRCRGGEESGQKYFCLTSFVWCYTKKDNSSSCSFPDNVLSLGEDVYSDYPEWFPAEVVGRWTGAVLLWDEEYKLTWENADPEYPVVVSWRAGSPESAGGDGEYNRWERNFTNGEKEFSFKFSDLASELAGDNDDVSIMTIKGRAGGPYANGIIIAQPDDNDQFDYSDRFSIVDSQIELLAETQHQIGTKDMYDKWKLGVGIGVGLGVPVFVGAAFAVGFFWGKGRGKNLK